MSLLFFCACYYLLVVMLAELLYATAIVRQVLVIGACYYLLLGTAFICYLGLV